MSQNVVVFFNKDVIIIKPLMIAVLLIKIALWGGGNTFWKTVEVALQKLLRGEGGGEVAPWLLATSPATYNKYPATWNLSDNPDNYFLSPFDYIAAVHTGTRPNLKLSGIWTKKTQSTTTVGFAKRFRLRILSYTIPYEFNIRQLLSGIGQRRSMNDVCQFIDHLMNEYVQDCD